MFNEGILVNMHNHYYLSALEILLYFEVSCKKKTYLIKTCSMEFHDNQANYLKSCGTISQTPPEFLDSIPINSEDANEVRIFHPQACLKIRHLIFLGGVYSAAIHRPTCSRRKM